MLTHLSDVLASCEQALQTELNISEVCHRVGNVLQSMGWMSAAISWHTRAAQLQIDRREVFAGLGRLYAEHQQWTKAIAAYESALELDADYDKAHWSLANIYAKLGEAAAEISHRRQVFQSNSRLATPKTQLEVGNRLWLVDEPAAAIECYRGALATEPDFFEAHYNLAITLMQQRDWSGACQALHQSLAIASDYAPTYYSLGLAYSHLRQWQKAQSYYRRAIELNPHDVLSWSALGEMCLKLHEWSLAQSAYERALELGGDVPWNYHNLGYALLKQQQSTDALIWLQRAVDLGLDTPWFQIRLGEALMQQERWGEAISALLQALQMQQNLPQDEWQDFSEAYRLLGRSLKQYLKDRPEQNSSFSAIDLGQPHLAFWMQTAQQLSTQQQYDGAIFCYQKALEIGPEAEGVEVRQNLEQQLQQVQTAQSQIQQKGTEQYWLIDQSADQPHHYTQLAHLLADQGETEAAIALHRQALKLKGWQAAFDRDYCFTRDWFTHNIVVWQEYLQRFVGQPGLQALEIGCFEGMASCWLLDHLLTASDARLVGIDPYVQDHFRLNCDRAQATEKVTYLIGESAQVLPDLSEQRYDLIYISGCPWADAMQQDGQMAWSLLKPNGVMIFDYYGWLDQQPIEQQSRKGIDAFIQSVRHEVEVLHRAYQMIVRKLISAS